MNASQVAQRLDCVGHLQKGTIDRIESLRGGVDHGAGGALGEGLGEVLMPVEVLPCDGEEAIARLGRA